jgi:aryl-alcohol dehydrogenase-like predicted oxidoreductase
MQRSSAPRRRDAILGGATLALAATAETKAEARRKAAPDPSAEAHAEWRNRQPGMTYRRLGRTGFMISRMVMGGDNVRPDNHDFILEAIDRGLNYLDTAHNYGQGRSEEGIREVLRARPRDKVFINTKISPWAGNRTRLYRDVFASLPESEQKKVTALAKEDLERRRQGDQDYIGGYFKGQHQQIESTAVADVIVRLYGEKIDRDANYKQIVITTLEKSLARMGTDHVDIMMCPHGASSPFEMRTPEILEAFAILKKQGKVRFLGVSSHSDPAGILETAAASDVYAMAMVAFNYANGRFVTPALKAAAAKNLGIIAMKAAKPFSGSVTPTRPENVTGLEKAVAGSDKIQIKAYKWVLESPYPTAVISDMTSREMVRENLALVAAPTRRRA